MVKASAAWFVSPAWQSKMLFLGLLPPPMCQPSPTAQRGGKCSFHDYCRVFPRQTHCFTSNIIWAFSYFHPLSVCRRLTFLLLRWIKWLLLFLLPSNSSQANSQVSEEPICSVGFTWINSEVWSFSCFHQIWPERQVASETEENVGKTGLIKLTQKYQASWSEDEIYSFLKIRRKRMEEVKE